MTSGADDALAAHELDLVTRASKGDDTAFDRFFERNAHAVQLLAERLLGPGEAADAVVVEAFEKTVRRLPLLGARNSSPALYVLSTARNGAYAALGRQRPSADGGPLGALLALPSRQRELLALRELGLAETDCAEIAGIDPREVGVQVARARLRLTDELEGLTLSTVFADDRAERLLAADVVRAEGAPLPDGLEEEITRHADEDSRFAAALSAVRSPSRSVGQLPAVTGASRLAAAARGGSVGTGRPAGIAAAGAAGAFAAANALAAPADVAAAPPAEGGGATPKAPSARRSDPYDETIGDEMAWGIVEDESDAPSFNASAAPGSPAVEAPTDGQWEDGAGAVSAEPAPPAAPGANHPPMAPAPPVAAGSGDPSLADPFAGWDDALDWSDEDKEWGSGPGAAATAAAAGGAAAAGAATPPSAQAAERTPPAADDATQVAVPTSAAAVPPEETRAFDVVGAGLADPGPFPLPLEDEPVESERRWRSRLGRWLIWLIAFALLFAGVAFATAAIVNALHDPSLPPKSTLDTTTPAKRSTTATPKASPKATPAAKKKSTSSSGSTTKKTTATSSSGGSGSSGASSSGSGSGSGSSGSTSTASTGNTGSTGGTSSSGTTKKTTTGATSKTSTSTSDDEVVSGETDSGGSVRGATDGGGTTP